MILTLICKNALLMVSHYAAIFPNHQDHQQQQQQQQQQHQLFNSISSNSNSNSSNSSNNSNNNNSNNSNNNNNNNNNNNSRNWSELATKFEPVSSKEDRKRKILHQIHVDPLLEVPSMKFCVYISLSTCRTAPSNLDLLGVVGTMGQKRSANRLFQVQKLVKTAYEWFDQKWNELEKMYSI